MIGCLKHHAFYTLKLIAVSYSISSNPPWGSLSIRGQHLWTSIRNSWLFFGHTGGSGLVQEFHLHQKNRELYNLRITDITYQHYPTRIPLTEQTNTVGSFQVPAFNFAVNRLLKAQDRWWEADLLISTRSPWSQVHVYIAFRALVSRCIVVDGKAKMYRGVRCLPTIQ